MKYMATIGCLSLIYRKKGYFMIRYIYYLLGAQKKVGRKKYNTQSNHVVVHFHHVFPACSPLFSNTKRGVNSDPRVRHETQSSSVCRARLVEEKKISKTTTTTTANSGGCGDQAFFNISPLTFVSLLSSKRTAVPCRRQRL